MRRLCEAPSPPPAALPDATRHLVGDPAAPALGRQAPAQRALAAGDQRLAAQRGALAGRHGAPVDEASRKSRTSATSSRADGRADQSVVVCNPDGRILLYNGRARALFAACSAPRRAGGAELIGLGRSIYAVFDRRSIAHALETVERRLARGEAAGSASSSPRRRPATLQVAWRRSAASAAAA